MLQSQTAALPRHQEEEETDKTKPNKRKSNKRTKSIKIKALLQLINSTLGPDATLNHSYV